MTIPTEALIETSPSATELISIILLKDIARPLKDKLINEAILGAAAATCFEVMLTLHAAKKSIPKALTEKLLGPWADFVKMMDELKAETCSELLPDHYEGLIELDEDELRAIADAAVALVNDCADETLSSILLDMADRYNLIERFKTAPGYLTHDLLNGGW